MSSRATRGTPMPDGAWTIDRDVVLEAHQADIVDDTTSLTLVLEGGLGCGKTFTGVVKMLDLIAAQPGVPGLWIEPTYDLIGSIFLVKIADLFDRWQISWRFFQRYKGVSSVLLVHYGTPEETIVFLRSGEHPERIVGFEVAWFILDEADQMSREVWRRSVQRHRHPGTRQKQRAVVFTPEPGWNWTQEVFHEQRKPTMRVIEGVSTEANPNNGDGYVADLIESHDEDERARVLTGKRTSLSGVVYKRFDPARHDRPCRDPLAGKLFIGADFNWMKMAWVFGRELDNGEIHIWGELIREHTDTIAQCEAALEFIADEFRRVTRSSPKRADLARMVQIVPDASVNQHRTSSAGTASDLDHLIRAGFDVRRPARNPPVLDRIFAMNMGFHEDRLFIDGTRCPFLKKCLTRQPWDEARQEPSKKEGLDHAPDAMGYPVHFFQPRALRRGNDTRRAA